MKWGAIILGLTLVLLVRFCCSPPTSAIIFGNELLETIDEASDEYAKEEEDEEEDERSYEYDEGQLVSPKSSSYDGHSKKSSLVSNHTADYLIPGLPQSVSNLTRSFSCKPKKPSKSEKKKKGKENVPKEEKQQSTTGNNALKAGLSITTNLYNKRRQFGINRKLIKQAKKKLKEAKKNLKREMDKVKTIAENPYHRNGNVGVTENKSSVSPNVAKAETQNCAEEGLYCKWPEDRNRLIWNRKMGIELTEAEVAKLVKADVEVKEAEQKLKEAKHKLSEIDGQLKDANWLAEMHGEAQQAKNTLKNELKKVIKNIGENKRGNVELVPYNLRKSMFSAKDVAELNDLLNKQKGKGKQNINYSMAQYSPKADWWPSASFTAGESSSSISPSSLSISHSPSSSFSPPSPPNNSKPKMVLWVTEKELKVLKEAERNVSDADTSLQLMNLIE